jgi:hypothetical protein
MAKADYSRVETTAHNQWTELLTCPKCGRSGAVHFSQPDGRTYDVSVESVPADFRVVRQYFGDAFYCKACNLQADPKNHDCL